MEHELAIKSLAAERYLLKEMTPEERDEFEEHYFSCSECADAVRTGTALTVNGREAVKEQALHPSRPGQVAVIRTCPGNSAPKGSRSNRFKAWTASIPAAVAAALLLMAGGQELVIVRHLKQPRSVSRATLHAQTRAAKSVFKVTGPMDSVLDLEIGDERDLSSCRIELVENGGVISTVSNAPVRDGMTELYLPGTFPSGDYEILVRAQSDGVEAGRFPIRIER